eukprot:3810281-Lingulodinium_polyedra.AAC.1
MVRGPCAAIFRHRLKPYTHGPARIVRGARRLDVGVTTKARASSSPGSYLRRCADLASKREVDSA